MEKRERRSSDLRQGCYEGILKMEGLQNREPVIYNHVS